MNGHTSKLLRRVAVRLKGRRPDKRLKQLWQASTAQQRAQLRPLLQRLIATSTRPLVTDGKPGSWLLDPDVRARLDELARSVIAPPVQRTPGRAERRRK